MFFHGALAGPQRLRWQALTLTHWGGVRAWMAMSVLK